MPGAKDKSLWIYRWTLYQRKKSQAKKGKDTIKISCSEEDFIFEIESWGQLKPKEIFTESIKALKKNLKELDKEVNKL